jgi:chaperonin GroEL
MQHKIGEIQVGGGTDTERGEEYDLIIDALNSAKSAMRYGVLPGGGVALYQASKTLENLAASSLIEDPSEQVAARILREALRVPIKLVIENKTALNSALVIEKIEAEGNMFTGFDVNREVICDMVEEGVVDSLQVVQTYLQDAVTLSGMLLTTECLVIKEKNYEPLPLKHYQDRRDIF